MNGGAVNGPVVVGLLALVVVLVAITLMVVLLLWWRHSGLSDRVTKLEVHYQHHLTSREVRQVFDRLATLEAKTDATNTMLKTVQEHLLENEE
ncbi:MAG: hypothetical protein ACREPD_06115 [Stenotrophomonas sp.]|uniref:hypothetical protein n=1 Tax=Stenotrophomonas sp. TaxID=69392 RepID=UPI003D6D3FD5